MDKKELNQLLDQLHEEINNTREVDETGIELLRNVESDIQALLVRSEEPPSRVHSSVLENLQSAIDHFEVTHPSLTVVIAELLEFLSNTGI